MDKIKNYAELLNVVGDHILCNQVAEHELELVSGDLYDENGDAKEVYQWYLIPKFGAFFLKNTSELVFYDPELDLYVWGVTFFGTPWESVPFYA